SAINGGSVMRVSLPDHEVVTARVGPGAEGIALSHDGASVWVGSNSSASVYVLAAGTLEDLAVVPTCGVPIRVTTVDPSLMAVTCMDDALIQLFDVDTRQLTSTVTLPGGAGRPVGTLASPDGARLYV